MKLVLFASLICLLYYCSNATPLLSDIQSSNTKCSENATSAWVDIILLIDTSSNMGTNQLQKISTLISLTLSKFTIGNNQYDMTTFNQSTRVAVVNYDAEANIAASFTNINSVMDLSNVLNGLQVSNTHDANLYDAFYQASTLKDRTNSIDVSRPTAYIVFASSIASPALNQNVSGFVSNNLNVGENDNVITINFNTADMALTKLLNNISTYGYANITMYNFISSSNTLAADLTWAILQTNCFCQQLEGIIMLDYDTTKNRWTRVAQCIILDGVYPNSIPDNIIDYCYKDGFTPLAISSHYQQQFVQNVYWDDENSPPYYVGLHKNSQSNWVWYDDNLTEYPATYFNWGTGYPKNNNCVVLDYPENEMSFVWKDTPCEPQYNYPQLIMNALCQSAACTSTSDACGYIEFLFFNDNQQKMSNQREAKKTSMTKYYKRDDGKIIRRNKRV